MEKFIKYEIKPKDTLASIAEKQGITEEDLINFHNQNCGVTGVMIHDKLPKYLQYLFLDATIPTKKKNVFSLNKETTGKTYNYRINFKQKLIANNKSFANMATEIIWSYKILEISDKKITVSIVTDSYEVKNQPPDTSKLINFSMMFNKPVKKLILELHDSGTISKVINQQEIFEKWLTIRNNELLEYQNEESMKGIFIAGDTEFSDTLVSLKGNLLYILFFDDIYGKKNTDNKYKNEQIRLYSKLFQGEIISFDNEQRIKKNNKIVTENKYFANPNIEKLQKMYQLDYKNIIGKDFEYDFHINSESNYTDEGILEELSISCIEKANEELFNQTQYNVQLIK